MSNREFEVPFVPAVFVAFGVLLLVVALLVVGEESAPPKVHDCGSTSVLSPPVPSSPS